jgi:pimeloyl-ACP methyl ester carboxylesterase
MLAACYGFRAALYYCEAGSLVQARLFEMMEKAFADASQQLGLPVRPITVPYGVAGLLGYFLEIDDRPRPTVLMIGGGDTCREDLFAFAGYPGWRRDYNVLMVDLPGQGRMPADGLVFQADADRAIMAAVDWLYANAQAPVGPVAIYGISGGGYFSAQGVTRDPRITAWVASTPIVDIAAVFRTEFGKFQALPNWLMSAALHLGGMLNRSVALSLRKYAWQFGTSDFAEAVRKTLAEATPVDVGAINCPCLFLVGASEAPELRRQTEMLSTILAGRAVSVTVRTFEKSEGADAHCQINNLRLAHLVVFDWLDCTFNRQPATTRLDAWRLV